MTKDDFFRLDQEQWFMEIKEAELPEIPTDTNPQIEKFIFEDIPF